MAKEIYRSTESVTAPDDPSCLGIKELAPGIVSDPGICSGDPIVAGTRIGVHDVVALAPRYKWDLDRVRTEELPHLSIEQLRAAIAWYRAHEEDIEEILRRRRASFERLSQRTPASR
jgi:uncharacterized protein (DUF433 family)